MTDESLTYKLGTLPPYEPPYGQCAAIVIHGQDFEHAEWIGNPDLPAPFSYGMLFCIERLPWKLLEVKDYPSHAIKWFKRVTQ